MSKKRKCRMTPEEQAIHKEAVRLRGLTDKQLVEQFHRAAEPETAENPRQAAHSTSETDETGKDTSDVQKLLTALAEGKCKGIKSGIAYKVSVLAAEMGLA